MHGFDDAPPPAADDNFTGPWYRQLNSYHWFVLIVAALGWLFDTMDQQLFVLARAPAMKELLTTSDGQPPTAGQIAEASGNVTSIFLIGWAIGGLGFGALGDKIGRAKTMLVTILAYSLFTGLSALSVGFWDFAAYRFLTGLGVGGEFAVGVALVAEVMPHRARPFALGLLQALSAVGNISAALISLGLGHLESENAFKDLQLMGIQVSAWRIMFVIGILPALLAVVIRRRLKEPERWQTKVAEAAAKRGSYAEMFGHPTWRRNAIVGMLMAFSGVVGLWAIGFFSPELTRAVFVSKFEQEFRAKGSAVADQQFVQLAVADPAAAQALKPAVQPTSLLGLNKGEKDAELLYSGVLALAKDNQPVTVESVLAWAEQKQPAKDDAERAKRTAYLQTPPETEATPLAAHAERIGQRQNVINGQLTLWAAINSIMINVGAFLGIYAFSYITHYVGRKPAFAVAFLLAGSSTAFVFLNLREFNQIFWMIPIMGFCQLSLFGGYAIYFPELFPTSLRSTGTSFCYNVGRIVAAVGPVGLGYLRSSVFNQYDEPIRMAGFTMCAVFLVGLMVLPFAPETKGKPLPE